MSKLPFLQFYPSDYLVDTRVLSLAARGAWVDIICVLHASSTRGTSTLPARGWARIMGATEADFQSALSEIEEMKVGDVIRNGNGDVSVTCRRMMNESITREQTRLRVQNHRNKHGNKAGNDTSNADVTPKKSEVISQKSEAEKQTASVSVTDASVTSDEDWLNQLAINPAYSLIDVRREYSKMQTWCSVNRKMPTRRRFVAWLNRIEKPMDAAKGNRAHESIIDRS
jgi:uncharacterized protein YdaU (DUF1376 family)